MHRWFVLKHQALPQRQNQVAKSIVAVGKGLPRQNKINLLACRWCMNNWKQKALKDIMVIEKAVDTTSAPADTPGHQTHMNCWINSKIADLRLLQWLLRYPFQRAEDLALAAGINSATAYRHLNVLHNLGLIERVAPAALGASTCRLYHLSNLGLHVLAAHAAGDPTELARTWRTDERGLLRLLPRLSSLVTLQECINGLVAHAPEALAHQGRRSEVQVALGA